MEGIAWLLFAIVFLEIFYKIWIYQFKRNPLISIALLESLDSRKSAPPDVAR